MRAQTAKFSAVTCRFLPRWISCIPRRRYFDIFSRLKQKVAVDIGLVAILGLERISSRPKASIWRLQQKLPLLLFTFSRCKGTKPDFLLTKTDKQMSKTPLLPVICSVLSFLVTTVEKLRDYLFIFREIAKRKHCNVRFDEFSLLQYYGRSVGKGGKGRNRRGRSD